MTLNERRTPDELLARFADAQALLATVTRELGPAVDLQSTLTDMLMAMRRMVDFRGGSISLVDKGRVSIRAADPAVSPEVLATSIPVGDGLAGRIAATGKAIYSPNIDLDDRVDPDLRRLGSNTKITSYLGVPLVSLGEVIGLLQIDSTDEDAFDEVDRIMLESLASQMALAIASARQFDDNALLDGMKNSFIQMVSHELRTPLTIGKGMLSVVRANLDEMDPDQTRDLLGRASGALERLDKLVEALLMMTRLMGGALRAKAVPTQLLPMLGRVQDKSLDPDSVQVLAADNLIALTDGGLLERVVAELVENALLYAGGCELDIVDGAITVRDYGPGIPDDVASIDFEKFNRGDARETTIAGLGLGLTMSRALLAELGGTLTLAGADGGGTIATIALERPPGD